MYIDDVDLNLEDNFDDKAEVDLQDDDSDKENDGDMYTIENEILGRQQKMKNEEEDSNGIMHY